MESLSDLREHVGDCHRCPLGDTRTHLVFGSGRADADVMLVGEAPGRNEDLGGEPFAGAAGKLLDELLAAAGLERSDVYIANILKCRPPKNRNPLGTEIQTCTPFLHEQMRIVAPSVIVTLGNFATRFVLGTRESITTLRGTLYPRDDVTVLPVFHPAASLYDRSKRDVLFADFALLGRVIAEKPDEGEVGP